MIEKNILLKEEHLDIFEQAQQFSPEELSDFLAQQLPVFIKRQELMTRGYELITLSLFSNFEGQMSYKTDREFMGKFLFEIKPIDRDDYKLINEVYLDESNELIIYESIFKEDYGLRSIETSLNQYSNLDEMMDNTAVAAQVLNTLVELINKGIVDFK